jgi:hypothetical protein
MHHRAFLILGFLGVGLTTLAQPTAQRQAVAKSVGEAGSILRRESAAKPWQLVADNEALQTGELLVAGAGATLEGNNGAVRLLLQGNVARQVPLPVIESAVVLHSSPDIDLDFEFLRGRVELINQKTKGEAKVRVRGQRGSTDIVLLQPGTRVALVRSGRWTPGVLFRKDAKDDHQPAQAFRLLVLKGEIEVKTAKHQFAMHALPGPALLEGDGVGDTDPSPRKLDKLPDWATAQADAEDLKKVKAGLARFQDLARKKSVAEALDQLLQSENLVDRRVAVALLGATDDLARLAHSLVAAPNSDTWENTVRVLRHWIGRERGQDQKLYQELIEKEKLTAIQAETILEMLHDFGDDALTQPETYEALLDLLDSNQQAICGLAHWQLYRLVPAGRKIGYDPLAVPEKRAQAVKEWRKLIPAGKLPPAK